MFYSTSWIYLFYINQLKPRPYLTHSIHYHYKLTCIACIIHVKYHCLKFNEKCQKWRSFSNEYHMIFVEIRQHDTFLYKRKIKELTNYWTWLSEINEYSLIRTIRIIHDITNIRYVLNIRDVTSIRDVMNIYETSWIFITSRIFI